MKTGDASISKLIEVLQLSVKENKLGRPTYPSPDEEAFVVAAKYIEGDNGLPIYTTSITYEIYSVVESVKEILTYK